MIKTPKLVEILDIIVENPLTKTLVLDGHIDAQPGQFVMIWLPGVNEKPMSVRKSEQHLHLCIEGRGDCTRRIIAMKKGEKIGLRGPYGRGFTMEKESILIGGGIGMPPLMNLYDSMGTDAGIRVLQGARSKERLLFMKSYPEMIVATEDGSLGYKGYITDILENEIRKRKPKAVYTCGPELMMLKVLNICTHHNIRVEASLERYMRCGFGVCASCVCGDRLVCLDGPVFSGQELQNNAHFGEFLLTASAQKRAIRDE